jgi:thiazole/oxazole-forming peptide maturase SagD family component
MAAWYDSPFTGILTEHGTVPPRFADPEVHLVFGRIPPWGARSRPLDVGGVGLDPDEAEGACVGEAIERLHPCLLPQDGAVEASVEDWPLDEPPVGPERWILFHPEQYAQPGFPLRPPHRRTRARWIAFRGATTGDPAWVPEDMAFLFAPEGSRHVYCPAVSTGLSAGRRDDPVVLRGLQEVIERDAVVGAWWERYPLEEWDPLEVWRALGSAVEERLARRHLGYRFFRVRSPWSDHVAVATVEGEDREGVRFAAGSACRETLALAFRKAALEAIHGHVYVSRKLRDPAFRPDDLSDFSHHAAYYSVHPEALKRTVFARAVSPLAIGDRPESVASLAERLGPERPVLFRRMTPPGIAAEFPEWSVVRVVVPGLQPLHGDDRLAHLGGPLWAPRGLAEWAQTPPHPFA